MKRSALSHVMVFGTLVLLTGCCPRPMSVKGVTPHYGPTLPMSRVVSAVNANNAPITSIYSDHHFWAWFHDDRGREHRFDGDGALLYRKRAQKPDELLMTGDVVTGKVFELGSTTGPEAEYWVSLTPPGEEATQWWGHYKNLGKSESQKVPIQPNLVTEVLGVTDVDTNFLQQPVPTMRFNNDARAYMFAWSVQLPDRWAVVKEVWFDVDSKLPTKVLLFDPDGRILLRANLFEHEAVEGADGKKIATRYDLFFPDTRDAMTIKLKNVQLKYKGRPNDRTFQRRPVEGRTVQIDENVK